MVRVILAADEVFVFSHNVLSFIPVPYSKSFFEFILIPKRHGKKDLILVVHSPLVNGTF